MVRRAPRGITHFTISLIVHLDEWQKAHVKQKQRGYKAGSLEKKGENDRVTFANSGSTT